MCHKLFHNPVILDVLCVTVFNGPMSMAAKYSEHFVSVLDDHEKQSFQADLLCLLRQP
jgi:hypothetical protein